MRTYLLPSTIRKTKCSLSENLPKEILYNNAKPFSSTGIDYFGSIKIKARKYAQKNSSTK